MQAIIKNPLQDKDKRDQRMWKPLYRKIDSVEYIQKTFGVIFVWIKCSFFPPVLTTLVIEVVQELKIKWNILIQDKEILLVYVMKPRLNYVRNCLRNDCYYPRQWFRP